MDSQQEFDSSSVPKANYRKISFAAESTVTSLEFSPITLPQTLVVAGSWDKTVRCIEVEHKDTPELISTMKIGAPVLDVCWNNSLKDAYRSLITEDSSVAPSPNDANENLHLGRQPPSIRQNPNANAYDGTMIHCHTPNSNSQTSLCHSLCLHMRRHLDFDGLKVAGVRGTGEKVFIASCDEEVLCWDLASNSTTQVGHHGAPVRICHWVTAPNFSCLMTGSWDKTLKFWDTRSPSPMMVINLPERCSYASVDYPMAVVGTTNSTVVVYHLGGRPQEYRQARSSTKYQYRCAAIFKDERCQPAGFALGTVEGRVIIEYASPYTMKDKFIFKCRSYTENGRIESIRPINHMAFHPFHGTLATVSSDGFFSYWDINAKKRLLQSPRMEQSITRCAFSETGLTFAYSVSYDWSKGPTSPNIKKMNHIYFRSCFNEIKPRD